MTERDHKAIIRIIYHIETIQTYMGCVSNAEEFNSNSLVQDAVIFNLLQIGEIAKTRISDGLIKQYANIPWNKIYGFRNRLVHDYTNITIDIVFDTIIEELPILMNELGKIVEL